MTYLNVLKEQLCKGDYGALIAIADNTGEEHFIKKKEHLISKYKSLINKNERVCQVKRLGRLSERVL